MGKTWFSWDTAMGWDPSLCWRHSEWCRSAGMSGTDTYSHSLQSTSRIKLILLLFIWGTQSESEKMKTKRVFCPVEIKYMTCNSQPAPAHLGLMQLCAYPIRKEQGNKQDLIELIDQEILDLNFLHRKPFQLIWRHPCICGNCIFCEQIILIEISLLSYSGIIGSW